MESRLRNDLIDPALLHDSQRIRVVSAEYFETIVNSAQPVGPTKSPGTAKDIVEVLELLRQVIVDYDERTRQTPSATIDVIYDNPERPVESEVISLAFTSREPGMFGQGRPYENKTLNRRPILRECVDDPDHPGYKRAVLGMFYDNTIRMTCWARTNKEASNRALWLERMMEEYSWYFVSQGTNRILFDGWRQNVTLDIFNNTYYGRPIDYFVRTERLWNVSQKTLEDIYIKLTFGNATQ